MGQHISGISEYSTAPEDRQIIESIEDGTGLLALKKFIYWLLILLAIGMKDSSRIANTDIVSAMRGPSRPRIPVSVELVDIDPKTHYGKSFDLYFGEFVVKGLKIGMKQDEVISKISEILRKGEYTIQAQNAPYIKDPILNIMEDQFREEKANHEGLSMMVGYEGDFGVFSPDFIHIFYIKDQEGRVLFQLTFANTPDGELKLMSVGFELRASNLTTVMSTACGTIVSAWEIHPSQSSDLRDAGSHDLVLSNNVPANYCDNIEEQ